MRRAYAAFFVLGLAAFLFTVSPSKASAADQEPFYVGILGGYVMPQSLSGSGGSETISLKNSWAIGAKAGYIIPGTQKWLAAEMEYQYLANQDVDVSGLSGHFAANNLMFNLIVRYPDGKIHPYAGGGIGCSWGTLNAFATAPSITGSVDQTQSAFGWQLLAGVNYEFAPKWSADLAYRYFSSKYNFTSREGVSADVTASSNMILLGINYHF
jgi:opacity protein-like surface antigen